MRHLLVEMCITFKSTDIHNICTVCHGVAIHHRFNLRTSPFPNFAMFFIDSASFSNRGLPLRAQGAEPGLHMLNHHVLWIKFSSDSFIMVINSLGRASNLEVPNHLKKIVMILVTQEGQCTLFFYHYIRNVADFTYPSFLKNFWVLKKIASTQSSFYSPQGDKRYLVNKHQIYRLQASCLHGT